MESPGTSKSFFCTESAPKLWKSEPCESVKSCGLKSGGSVNADEEQCGSATRELRAERDKCGNVTSRAWGRKKKCGSKQQRPQRMSGRQTDTPPLLVWVEKAGTAPQVLLVRTCAPLRPTSETNDTCWEFRHPHTPAHSVRTRTRATLRCARLRKPCCLTERQVLLQ